MLVDNKSIARLLRQVATAYIIKDEKKFRFQVIAYQRAAEAIEHEVNSVQDLYKEHKLHTIPGVGPSIQKHLEELCKTGEVKHFDSILKDVPEAMFPLLDLPTLGPKKAYKLVTAFGLKDPKTVIADIEQLAKEGKIAQLENFGEKSQSEILKTVQQAHLAEGANERMPLPYATEMANAIIIYMKKCKDTKIIYPLGSLRRKMETIGDIDLAVGTDNPSSVLNHFVAYPYKSRVLDKGDIGASILANNGRRVDVKTQSVQTFGSLLQHFTGNKAHNVHLREIALKQGMSLSEKGIKIVKTGKMKTYKDEKAFYHELGMQWIPPEMREDAGEIELATKHQIPALVELSDIKGDFHLHSSFDIDSSHDTGVSTIETMVEKAKSLGYSYVAFSEHNPGVSKHSDEDIYSLIKKRNDVVDKIYTKIKSVRIIKMLEVDIMTNGKLAINDNALDLLDGAIVSIHSSFQMDRETMTERILKGLSHPKVKIFAHPSGRLINSRAGYQVAWEKLFAFCAKHDKALEINAFPSRLDLVDSLVRQAKKYNIKFAIDTDSHAVDQMDLMQYGVYVARRGWLTRHDIINCMKYEDVMKWLQRR